MPIRYRLFPFPASRFMASAATLTLAMSAAAGQPLLPEPPPIPGDSQPFRDDAVPHEVIPVPADVAPMPPAAAPHAVPPQDGQVPSYIGPPDGAVPYSADAPVPFDPHHDPFGPRGGLGDGPPSGWAAPGPPPAWAPPGPSVPSLGSAVPMRPPAPLAPLPPVGDDPTLGPPPGTIGHTYYRPSRYIPFDEHPRVGMIDLTLPPDLTIDQGPGHKIRVTVHDIGGQLKPLEGYFADDKHWHFESQPLTPGIPHIYRVKVERVHYENQEIRRYGRLVTQEVETGADVLGVRYLRLIPGRIVTLEF